MPVYTGTIPLNKKNVNKDDWNHFINWQKHRNEERLKRKIKETDIYISSGELSPETWESVINEHTEDKDDDIANLSSHSEEQEATLKSDQPQNTEQEAAAESPTEEYGPLPLLSGYVDDRENVEVNKNSVSTGQADLSEYEALGYVKSGISTWKLIQEKAAKERENRILQEAKLNKIQTMEERSVRENELIDNLKKMIKKQNELIDKSNV